jgi:hypothetical protein
VISRWDVSLQARSPHPAFKKKGQGRLNWFAPRASGALPFPTKPPGANSHADALLFLLFSRVALQGDSHAPRSVFHFPDCFDIRQMRRQRRSPVFHRVAPPQILIDVLGVPPQNPSVL